MADRGMASLLVYEDLSPTPLPDFVETVEDKFICIVCIRILRPPIKQTLCGHRLCQYCEPVLLQDGEVQCPGNEEDCVPLRPGEIYPDRAATRELMRLVVFCSYRTNGCDVTTTWAQLSHHTQSCVKKPVKCSNSGCSDSISENQLAEHMKICKFSLERCPVCNEAIPRNEMNNGHMENCSKIPQKCVLNPLGCQFEATLDKHETHLLDNIQGHSRDIASAIDTQRRHQTDLDTKVTEIQLRVSGLENTVAHLKANLDGPKDIQSINFAIDKLTIDLDKLKDKVGESVPQQQLRNLTEQISDVKQITAAQESRLAHIEHGHNDRSHNPDIVDKVSRIETTVSMHDVRIAESDLRFRMLETASFDGNLVWRIPNYSRRKQDAIDGRTLSLYSQPFYTAYYGYKMCARVYLNGDGLGKGSHLSLFFVIMRGEYDPLLDWPFRQRVTLLLLDQTGNRKHIRDTFRPDPTSTSFRKPVGEMNIASGSPLFAPHSRVESGSYITDDTLFVCVSVDKTDIKLPWQ